MQNLNINNDIYKYNKSRVISYHFHYIKIYKIENFIEKSRKYNKISYFAEFSKLASVFVYYTIHQIIFSNFTLSKNFSILLKFKYSSKRICSQQITSL